MKKLIFTSIFAILSFFSHAQIDKTYFGITFLSTDFLSTTQNQSKLLPTSRNDGLDRLIINHHFSGQYHFLIANRVELNVGLGLNLQYYSLKGQEHLSVYNEFLNTDRVLLPSEDNDEVAKLRFNNVKATLPIGVKFFFKKDPLEGAQPAFSLQFLTEQNVHSRVNARYITGRDYLFTHRSGNSSIDSEIEHFYQKAVTKLVHSLRIGFSFQHGGVGVPVRQSSFDVHYVHYFESFDSGITKSAKGISCAWKWQF